MQQFVSLLPIIGIALLFWLLLIRPASKRQKEMRRMQGALEVGDDVMLSSGIFGTLANLEDENVHLVVADGVTIKVARGAIASVVPAETVTDAPEEG